MKQLDRPTFDALAVALGGACEWSKPDAGKIIARIVALADAGEHEISIMRRLNPPALVDTIPDMCELAPTPSVRDVVRTRMAAQAPAHSRPAPKPLKAVTVPTVKLWCVKCRRHWNQLAGIGGQRKPKLCPACQP